MNGKRTFVLIVIGVITLLGLGLLLTNTLKKPATPSQRTNQPQTQEPEAIKKTEGNAAQFKTSTYRWQSQKQYEVEIAFDKNPDPYPTAFTLHLLFDPEILRVDDVEIGNLWTGENILQNEIDNQNGVVMYSAGQGFQDNISNQRLMATLKVTVINTNPDINQATIDIGPESATASVGFDYLIDLNISPITIDLER